MREIYVKDIAKTVRDLAVSAVTELGEDVLNAFQNAIDVEESPIGKDILHLLIENAEIARKEGIPMCQDTGLAVVFVEMGRDVHVTGGSRIRILHWPNLKPSGLRKSTVLASAPRDWAGV